MKSTLIKRIFKDKHGFLESYIKANLPTSYYKNSIEKRISKTKEMRDLIFSESDKKEAINYWKKNLSQRISTKWHKAYSLTNGISDPRYIPEYVFYNKIEQNLNRFDLAKAYEDKNNYDNLFKDYALPVTVIRNINGNFYDNHYRLVSFEQANLIVIENIKKSKKLICKPSIESGGGKNIEVIKISEENANADIEAFFNKYQKDFIIQEYIEQHSLMSEMHKESLNTIRIITLRFNDEIHFLSGIVRTGNNGSIVDNATVGGLTCGFDEYGNLNTFATEHDKFSKHEVHPSSKFAFEGNTIPAMFKIKEFINNLHNKLLYFDIVSWDIAIDKFEDPILIEINLKMQDINFHQRNNGPLFGELTDQVLKKVLDFK